MGIMGIWNTITTPIQYKPRAHPISWGWMCMPRIPFISKSMKAPPFFHIDEELSWPIAFIMGLQHALAMIGGIITVPLLISGPFDGRFTSEEQEYLIAAGLIVSGLLSAIQITQFNLPFGYKLGTGLISVMGTSFTFLPIARTSIAFMKAEDSGNKCVTDADCKSAWAGQFGPLAGQAIPGKTNAGQCNTKTGFCKFSGQEAYGAFLGTCLVCVWLEILLSFCPPRFLKRAFPPMVTGVCVMLIGVALTGTGLKYWGGGAFCADNYFKRQRTTVGVSQPGDVTKVYESLYSKSPCVGGGCAPFGKPLSGICQYTPASYDAKNNMTKGDVTKCEAFNALPGVFPAYEDADLSWQMCTGNGEVVLPFGSPEYLGLGLSVFLGLIIIELFGSPVLRNCEVIIALIFGYFVAGVSHYVPPGTDTKLWYVTPARIDAAPGITFLWVKTFPISFYTPAVIPLLIGFIVTTIETIGDITASAEASRVATEGDEFDSRVQGGLLADGVNSFLAVLGTTAPNTTFSQNNGVIALSRCGNKRAGYMCCVCLLVFGILAKISAVIAAIPECVLGGMTTFLFVNIVVGGVRILARVNYTGRNRFIVAIALGLGIGNAIVPQWSANGLFHPAQDSTTKLGQDTVVIILQTPYCIGTLLALFLHALMPEEIDEDDEPEEYIPKTVDTFPTPMVMTQPEMAPVPMQMPMHSMQLGGSPQPNMMTMYPPMPQGGYGNIPLSGYA